jgi:hypothetical protein
MMSLMSRCCPATSFDATCVVAGTPRGVRSQILSWAAQLVIARAYAFRRLVAHEAKN